MRRLALALLGLALTAAAPVKDWRTNATVAPSGAFVVGNPAAKVKLVEYLSFTCSHCGEFVHESKAALHDTMVRDGSVQVETRSAARDPYDLAAWLVARCGGPRRFHALASAIFADQDGWTTRGGTWAQANLTALKAMPQLGQLRAIADHSGLSAIGTKAGITAPALNACFASDTDMKKVLAMTDVAFSKIPGTPGFEVNGTLAPDTFNWATLEPKLRAAGAR